MSDLSPGLFHKKTYTWYPNSGSEAETIALKLSNWLLPVFDMQWQPKKFMPWYHGLPGCLRLVCSGRLLDSLHEYYLSQSIVINAKRH